MTDSDYSILLEYKISYREKLCRTGPGFDKLKYKKNIFKFKPKTEVTYLQSDR